ncbi:MAG TPA: N-acetylornithine carbamoyltransferase [Methylomirabilota bacterium]|jgi:N-acetylornithine carbamoyltransferase|nr:N-acetylornithine carbamoyltransferase [Methylomirabilota bacterium]
MKHATRLSDIGLETVKRILSTAKAWKGKPHPKHLPDKLLGMLFFNPSLRTRVSFEAVMARGGGNAVVMEAGSSTWKFEDRLGAVMDVDRAEHLKEAVPVLCRYVDALAVRTFADGVDDDADHDDAVIKAFRQYATVPVVSMESAREHPCQGMADLLTIEQQFGSAKGLPVTLTWAPHIKALPKAVPNSFLLTAAALGCKLRVAHPRGFELHADVVREAEIYAAASGGTVSFFHEQYSALNGSRAVYAKAWGPATLSGLEPDVVRQYADWMVSPGHMEKAARDAIFLHCLPVRRNVEVADAVLDGPWSRVVDQAENRFHVQRALLDWLLS